jgi:hypothetical protein
MIVQHLQVSGSLVELALERLGEIAVVVVMCEGVWKESHLQASLNHPVTELVVFPASQPLIESAQALELRTGDREMATQQVTERVAVPGRPERALHLIPPVAQHQTEVRRIRDPRWEIAQSHNVVLPLVRRRVRGNQPWFRLDIVVEEQQNLASCDSRTGIAGDSCARVLLLNDTNWKWPLCVAD